MRFQGKKNDINPHPQQQKRGLNHGFTGESFHPSFQRHTPPRHPGITETENGFMDTPTTLII